MQDFSCRFKKTYDAIPTDVKPPPGAAKLHYADAFSSEFTLLLRERRSVSLEDMMDDATKVEVTCQHLIETNRDMRPKESKMKNHKPPPHHLIQMLNMTQ